MFNKYSNLFFPSLAFCIGLISYLYFNQQSVEIPKMEKIRSSSSPKAGVEMKKGRDDYFFYMLRDPATNKIPFGIRTKELEFAKQLNERNKSLGKVSETNLSWSEAGPNNVGGRTRALAVDVTNPNTIIAGGASGGIWKSTDNGASWYLKSSSSTILSVSSIAQDPRPGFTSTWYYTTGERSSNLAGTAATKFTGDGIYKSIDNGESWNVLQSTLSSNFTSWESPFDYTEKIVVSPTNGNIYVAAYGYGIYRSTDGGNSFNLVLGSDHIYSDVAVASNGNLLAVLSKAFQGTTPQHQPGLYKSTNDGTNWTAITPGSYPSTSLRSVLIIAASNPNIGYMLTYTGGTVNNREEIKFYKINFNAGSSEDRSTNIPDFTADYPTTGFYTSQGGYDMALAIKPDNENFVMIGGTNLFRSVDGFATKPTDVKTTWIGGYFPAQGFALYPNFHSDIHSFAFDPTDPKKMWWGHDGGLSYASDITNSSYQNYFPWDSKNNGYNVTQFYHISINTSTTDGRIMGGTQDNGTPYFNYTGTVASKIEDVSSGDGSYSYFGQNFAYTSSQNGSVLRLKYDQQGNPSFNAGWSEVTPTGSSNQFFINPFEVDPNNENVMYYPAGNVLWRNNQLSSIPDYSNGTSSGWTKLDNLTVPNGYGIYAMTVSKTPANILYYGASSGNGIPKIYKLTNSTTATSGAVEIPIPGAQSGAYVHNIAVNPDDANEILVVLSNYNIVGLYHSTNGGQSYTAVEGNLEGTQQNPGPSLRAATILPGTGSKTYFLATSIGMFSTTQLNGNNTVWTQEGQNVLGNVIVSHVTSRKSDGRVVAGTHGRGAFVGSAGGSAAVLNVNLNQLHFEVQPKLTATEEIVISNPGGENLSFTVSASGGLTNFAKQQNFLQPKISSSYTLNNRFREESNKRIKFQLNENSEPVSSLHSRGLGDELILDDGDAFPDAFFGAALAGYHFYWANRFVLDKDFALEKIRFHMKTESASSNSVGIEIQSSNGTVLFSTIISTDLSSVGKWYEFEFPQNALANLTFQNGESFYVVIASLNTALTFPAGYDDDGIKPGHSFWAYYEVASGYWSGYVTVTGNAAWLVRAVGNSGGANQSPTANAQVTPNPANINQTVNFNGSGSSDPDGQITQYSWEFGDGATSNQMNTTHSYSQAGQFNYKLTVTDNQGATDDFTGQITISDQPSRWTVNPSSGTVSPGGSQIVSITYSALNVPEGNYQGQINITSNGGNINIPVTIFISKTVDVNENESKIYSYKLEQNYPNPFNPSTRISWQSPVSSHQILKVYDVLGNEVATLVNEYKPAGKYEIEFNAEGLASGMYTYKLQSGNFVETKKMSLLK